MMASYAHPQRILSREERAIAVFAHAWSLLPSIKERAILVDVSLEQLGSKHGSYGLDDGHLAVNERLFVGNAPNEIIQIDTQGDSPPRALPCVSRALHTCIHELFHAIGAGTWLDQSEEWLALSGWSEGTDNPPGTKRYFEDRPGWPMGFSEWRHREGIWFVRPYSARSPYEDFADTCTHITLGWSRFFPPAAAAKLAYLKRHVWQETGLAIVTASRHRWQARYRPRHIVHALLAAEDDEEDVLAAIADINEQQKRRVLAWLAHQRGAMFPRAAAITAILGAIGPWLLKTYRAHATSSTPDVRILAMIRRAAGSYTATTERWLHAVLAESVPASELPALIEKVYARSSTSRARQLMQTERHRIIQAAREAAWVEAGAVAYKVWRTTSARPCSFCEDLDGRRIAIGTPFFELGETILDATGKSMTLDYEDVYHPPIHVGCQCTLERG